MTRRQSFAAAAGAGALVVAGLVAGNAVPDSSSSSTSTVTQTDTVALGFNSATQYQGLCSVVTPPKADPCDAAAGTLKSALDSFQRGTYHAKWVAANPGEIARLNAFMQAPACSNAPVGLPQIMLTNYGAALYAVVQAIGCALHPEPVSWPALPPAATPGRTDKTPPSSPGQLTQTNP